MSAGVSVITCTNKRNFMENIILNFIRQTWKKKELIIILNSNRIKLSKWKKIANRYKDISIFQLPERLTLGQCLNFAIRKAKYEWIAKFDDDDYYAPYYLAEAVHCLHKTKADVVGKRSYYMYWPNNRQLRIRFPGHENRRSTLVHGGTIMGKKSVFQAVPFANRSLGEDFRFLQDCRSRGYRIYSTSRFNYCYMRRNDQMHTWKADRQYLLKTSREVAVTSQPLEFINRGLRGLE